MKKILSLICAMLLTCVFVANAQNDPEKIQFTGTLVNPTTAVTDYRIQVSQTGKDKRVLEDVKPNEDGSFNITVTSDRPVCLVVKDQQQNIVFRCTFFGQEGNRKLELNKIDLSKEPKGKK